MSLRLVVGSVSDKDGKPVSFVERYARSGHFDQIFKEGMALVERAAAYLDGPGRNEAKQLAPAAAVVYATESMRMTTRLLELASWLLVRRSLKAGEIDEVEARVKRRRIKLTTVARTGHVRGYDELPAGLRELIEASYVLNDRIVQLDRGLERPQLQIVASNPNPVARQMDLISEAFTDGQQRPH